MVNCCKVMQVDYQPGGRQILLQEINPLYYQVTLLDPELLQYRLHWPRFPQTLLVEDNDHRERR